MVWPPQNVPLFAVKTPCCACEGGCLVVPITSTGYLFDGADLDLADEAEALAYLAEYTKGCVVHRYDPTSMGTPVGSDYSEPVMDVWDVWQEGGVLFMDAEISAGGAGEPVECFHFAVRLRAGSVFVMDFDYTDALGGAFNDSKWEIIGQTDETPTLPVAPGVYGNRQGYAIPADGVYHLRLYTQSAGAFSFAFSCTDQMEFCSVAAAYGAAGSIAHANLAECSSCATLISFPPMQCRTRADYDDGTGFGAWSDWSDNGPCDANSFEVFDGETTKTYVLEAQYRVVLRRLLPSTTYDVDVLLYRAPMDTGIFVLYATVTETGTTDANGKLVIANDTPYLIDTYTHAVCAGVAIPA